MLKQLPIIVIVLLFVCTAPVVAQVDYPFPIKSIVLKADHHNSKMVYMDVAPAIPNGKTVVLLHGKNFSGFYWKTIAGNLVAKGYRVIMPDQIGWGRSDKPVINYSFNLLAYLTKTLLDTMGIEKIILVGHSMGGMLASRFAIQYPDMVSKLVLENPIGLEDYQSFVPYQPLDKLYDKERAATYESYKKYQQGYYPEWKPEYEQYVMAQAESLSDPGFDSIAKVNALTFQMIYNQPVCNEWHKLKMPVLLIIGQKDRTVVGKDQLTEAEKKLYGNYPLLGKKTKQLIKQSKLVELPNAGHIPHIQEPAVFLSHLLRFIQ